MLQILATKPKTVDGIPLAFNKTIDDLREVADTNLTVASNKRQEAAEAIAASDAAAIEHAVDSTDPRIRALPNYRKRLLALIGN